MRQLPHVARGGTAMSQCLPLCSLMLAFMTAALFRIAVPGAGPCLARGDTASGPAELLPAEISLDGVLSGSVGDLGRVLVEAPAAGEVPPGAAVLAPVESQEVWAAGVTYRKSRDARIEEAAEATPYDLVYEAERPELFFKSAGWRARGPGQYVAVRGDSAWDVPEPELALIIAADGGIAGYSIGDDVSSRSIEGENPLYLPQAKVYDGSCAVGPCIVPASAAGPPFGIRLEVERGGTGVFAGETSTGQMRRSLPDLARWLRSALSFPAGAVLLTGTGIVPGPPFTLTEGDTVRISIDSLGTLENPVERLKTCPPSQPGMAASGPRD
jgi:2-dehydro-3-deoxy-D-arabinonate dehydratase